MGEMLENFSIHSEPPLATTSMPLQKAPSESLTPSLTPTELRLISRLILTFLVITPSLEDLLCFQKMARDKHAALSASPPPPSVSTTHQSTLNSLTMALLSNPTVKATATSQDNGEYNHEIR